YFLGKQPLSGFAKGWNMAVAALGLFLVMSIAWAVHTESLSYRMAARLRQAEKDEAAGQTAAAFRGYTEAADSGTDSAAAAGGALEALFTTKLATLPAKNAAELLRLGAERAASGRPQPSKKTVLDAARALAEARLAAEPRDALRILDSVGKLAGDSKDHAARRAAALRAAAARHPDDPDLASELAVLLESEKDLAGCEKVLTPLADKLGTREGARILGTIHADAGRFDQARKLLTGYCEGRLKTLHATVKEYNQAQQAVADGAIARLRAGSAGPSWYQAYEAKAADKAAQQAMVDEYVTRAINSDLRLKKLGEQLSAQAAVVPVALDLGMVMLRRAQAMTGEERRKELLAAEGVFLAVQGVAEGSDTYRISYGQVLYWLGKATEGRKLFDEYLASKKRGPESLYVVAHILREVGATSESWTLGEEAYNQEKDPTRKQGMANFMAASSRDLDTTVVWLGRCNPADKDSQAHLASCQGHLAARDGKDREAEAAYRRSVALYADIPKSPTTLNNCALVYGSLFRVSGKAEDFRRAASMLEEAVGLEPDKRIVAGNAADHLEGCAVLTLLEGRLNYKALGLSPDESLLTYCYDDQAGREEVVGRYTKHPSFQRALELRKRSLLLAPRDQHCAAALMGTLSWLRDEPGLLELQNRLKEVPLDLDSYRQVCLDGFAGKKETESRKAMEVAIAKLAKVTAEPRLNADDLTPDVAGVQLLNLEMSAASSWGRALDLDAAVARAEKLVAARPCRATRSALASALVFRISRRLAAANPGYAAALEKCRRSLGDGQALLLVAGRDPAFRAAAAANPDMKRLLALDQEDLVRLPKHVSVWQWALRKQFSPETAKEAADLLAGNRVNQLLIELGSQITPMDAGDCCVLHWLFAFRGQADRAAEVLRAAAKDGVPLP
ncbi:MAG TPA: hypothetical protein PK280_13790, partial [Planctomycetota bacterium]|nr:hypothetical protein [Planctomycetota bacterium]